MSNYLCASHLICTRILQNRYHFYTVIRDEKAKAYRSLIIFSWSTVSWLNSLHQNLGASSLTMRCNFPCSVVRTIFLCFLHPFSCSISCFHTDQKLVNILYYSDVGTRFPKVIQINLPDVLDNTK